MRIAMSFLAAASVLLLHWLGGYDFDQRGPIAVGAALIAGICFVFVYSYPGWSDKE